jgi:hypothetical protein
LAGGVQRPCSTCLNDVAYDVNNENVLEPTF